MNSKMTTNSKLLTTEPKKKKKGIKQTSRTGTDSQKWRSHGGYQWGDGGRRTGEKVQGIRRINGQREDKNSVGNVEAKALICMSHGHELKEGNVGGRECAGQRGIKGGNAGGRGYAGQRGIKGAKWDNYISIINKIYFIQKEKINIIIEHFPLFYAY